MEIIDLVKCMYSNSRCAVVDGTGTSEWFTIKSGVKKRCNMSGFLFLLVIDWILRKTTSSSNTGIRWNFTSKLEDLYYADDIALLSSTTDQMQRKSNLLNTYVKSTGLKINAAKTKAMRMNTNNNKPIEIDGTAVDDAKHFIYLGATVSETGGTNEDIRRRLGHARLAYNKLKSVWNNSQFGRKTQMKLLKSNVLSVLLYGSETWKMTKGDEKILDTFLHKCIRCILKIYWPEKITNTEARKRDGLEKISTIVKKRGWQWIGHVLRMDNNRNARTALDWAPEGKRQRGRPKETWRGTVEKERKQLGLNTWAEATIQAQDRSKWRELVHGTILHEETGN